MRAYCQYLQYIYIATLFAIVPVQAIFLNAFRANAHNNSLSFDDKDDSFTCVLLTAL
jgi:ABC-type uncharacterized transport system permease subunit